MQHSLLLSPHSITWNVYILEFLKGDLTLRFIKNLVHYWCIGSPLTPDGQIGLIVYTCICMPLLLVSNPLSQSSHLFCCCCCCCCCVFVCVFLWWTVFDEESKNIHPIPSQGRPTLCGLCVNISSLCFCLQSSLHAAESMHHSNKDSDCRCSCVWLHQTSVQTRSVVKKWLKTLLFGEISPTHCMFTRMIRVFTLHWYSK